MKTFDIQIRDPYILPVHPSYYLFGTTDLDCWKGPGQGFNCFRSSDLENWEGPFPAFRPAEGFWGTTNFWAPEAHVYQGRYYLLATFKAPNRFRGTQILMAGQPEGPYWPISDGPITPPGWECLDGTLYVDSNGQPWIVFCHEWIQVHDGGMFALPLSKDLTRSAGRPVFLFTASEASWSTNMFHPRLNPEGSNTVTIPPFPCHVTDGPFLHTTADGNLLMLWSSHGKEGYAMGLARSASGLVTGPWVQQDNPLWGKDGGHGMIFCDFNGQLYMTLHTPNDSPNERARFVPVREENGLLVLA